jgi:hypothetical protein
MKNQVVLGWGGLWLLGLRATRRTGSNESQTRSSDVEAEKR